MTMRKTGRKKTGFCECFSSSVTCTVTRTICRSACKLTKPLYRSWVSLLRLSWEHVLGTTGKPNSTSKTKPWPLSAGCNPQCPGAASGSQSHNVLSSQSPATEKGSGGVGSRGKNGPKYMGCNKETIKKQRKHNAQLHSEPQNLHDEIQLCVLHAFE